MKKTIQFKGKAFSFAHYLSVTVGNDERKIFVSKLTDGSFEFGEVGTKNPAVADSMEKAVMGALMFVCGLSKREAEKHLAFVLFNFEQDRVIFKDAKFEVS